MFHYFVYSGSMHVYERTPILTPDRLSDVILGAQNLRFFINDTIVLRVARLYSRGGSAIHFRQKAAPS